MTKPLPQALKFAVDTAKGVELHIAKAMQELLTCRPILQGELANLDNDMQNQPSLEAFAAVDVAIFDIMSALQAANERLVEASAHLNRIETLAASAATFCPQPDTGEQP